MNRVLLSSVEGALAGALGTVAAPVAAAFTAAPPVPVAGPCMYHHEGPGC